MESSFDQLVASLYESPLSTDVLDQIVRLLQQQTDQSLSSFVSRSLPSLLTLERWAWELFSHEYRGWIDEPSYQQLLRTLVIFNEKLIFNCGEIEIEIETKGSLLFSVTIEQINSIFMHIERSNNDDDPFIAFISLWLDNHSYFLFNNSQFSSPIIKHIGGYISNKYIMSKEYKMYLTQLRQPNLPDSVFTTKLLFYIKTCSYFYNSFLIQETLNLCELDEIIRYLREDYLEIIHVHSYTVASWSKELLGCIARLLSFTLGCCWSDQAKNTQMEIMFPTETAAKDHFEEMMRIISDESFYKEIKTKQSNDENILACSILTHFMLIMQMIDMDSLSHFNTTLKNTIVTIIDTTINDEVALCGYGVLCEVMGDEELKAIRINDNISNNFLHILEVAWSQTTKKYKRIPLMLLLKGT